MHDEPWGWGLNLYLAANVNALRLEQKILFMIRSDILPKFEQNMAAMCKKLRPLHKKRYEWGLLYFGHMRISLSLPQIMGVGQKNVKIFRCRTQMRIFPSSCHEEKNVTLFTAVKVVHGPLQLFFPENEWYVVHISLPFLLSWLYFTKTRGFIIPSPAACFGLLVSGRELFLFFSSREKQDFIAWILLSTKSREKIQTSRSLDSSWDFVREIQLLWFQPTANSPGTHLGILDHVPFLHTGVELWVFWNCDKQWTSMVWECGTLEPEARSETNPCEMWGTTQGAANNDKKAM